MNDDQKKIIENCAQALRRKLPWFEAVEARVEGELLHLYVSHSYPVDVRRDVARVVRRVLNRLRTGQDVQLSVVQVPAGYAHALRAAQEIAVVGRDRPDDFLMMWN